MQGKPCHMYFDLEFNRKANIEADGEAMVDILLSVVQKAFLDIYALEYDPSWTIELDSTTEGCMLFTGLSFASSCPHFLLVFFFLGIFLVYKSGEIAPNMCMWFLLNVARDLLTRFCSVCGPVLMVEFPWRNRPYVLADSLYFPVTCSLILDL